MCGKILRPLGLSVHTMPHQWPICWHGSVNHGVKEEQDGRWGGGVEAVSWGGPEEARDKWHGNGKLSSSPSLPLSQLRNSLTWYQGGCIEIMRRAGELIVCYTTSDGFWISEKYCMKKGHLALLSYLNPHSVTIWSWAGCQYQAP